MTTENTTNITTSGLPIFDKTTGDFSAVAATTLGDAIVHNGSNYIRLGAGVDDKVLTADSTQASGFKWDDLTFTGDFILLETVNASSSSTVDFTDLDVSTYATLFFSLVNVHPASDNVQLRCLFSTDNGSTFISSGYEYVYRILDAGSGTDDENHDTSATYFEAADRIGNAAGEGIAGWFWFLPSGDPTQTRHSIEWQLYGQDAGNDLNGYWGGGINSVTNAVDAIRFQFSSGNIEVGDFYLYGLSAS